MPSVIGISTLPNQRHRIASRTVQPYTLLLVGQSGLGKTTLMNTLFGTQILTRREELTEGLKMEKVSLECEEMGVRVDLSIVDCKGYGDYVDNEYCWSSIIQYIDTQYKNFYLAERRPDRSYVVDTRVHAVLYFIEPTGHTLKPLDVQVMKMLGQRVNLIPIIAKADTIAPVDMIIRECMAENNITVLWHLHSLTFKCFLPALSEDDDTLTSQIVAAFPLSVIGSTQSVALNGAKVLGRVYPWGLAEVENPKHCDFVLLKNLLIKFVILFVVFKDRTHMYDVISGAKAQYEAYRYIDTVSHDARSKVMLDGGVIEDTPPSSRKDVDQKMKEEEELLRKRFTEQVRKEEQRFKMWEQKLIGERDRLNKDLESHHSAVKALEDEIEALFQSSKA